MAARLGILIGEERYLVDLADAGEIVPIPEAIAPVPLTREWFSGLVNLRGVLYAVTDLGPFQGRGATVISRESRLLAFASRLNVNAAIVVSRMLGLHNVSAMTESAPDSKGAAWCGRRLTDPEGRVWTELSLTQLIEDQRFLSVAR